MKKIIALMRTHNSEWILPRTLTALSSQVEGIIIHDDNSTDKTVEIAKSFNKVLEVFENKKTFYHEGMDKAILLNLGRKHNPDFFLMMDDDEIIPNYFRNHIDISIMKDYGTFTFPLLYLWNSYTDIRVDGIWCNQLRTKLHPNTKELFVPNKVCHATIEPMIGNNMLICCPIIHYGYCTNEKINEKLVLYRELGEDVNEMSNDKLEKCFNSKPELMDVNNCVKRKIWMKDLIIGNQNV